jgi:hypothetical protein
MPTDLTDVIVSLERSQNLLRAIDLHPSAYPEDAIARDTIVNLALVLEARVQQWLKSPRRRENGQERRHAHDRRHHDRRGSRALEPVP